MSNTTIGAATNALQHVAKFYGFFMPSPWRGNRVFTALLRKLCPAAIQPLPGVGQMNILDGLSLAMAIGLFIYLLVALLRADRS